MIDFDFISPTKIYFGKDKEIQVGNIIANYGFKKVLLHYGKSSIKKIKLYDRVIASLKKENIEFVELGGVEANPDVSLVKEGIKIARENQVDFILAVGGGSVIDSAKLIACGYYYDKDPFDFSLHKLLPEKTLPLGVILTNSASGSELSSSCVISSREMKIKKGFNTDLNRPLFVIENPEITYSLGLHLTGEGIVDIISHTFERYFCHSNQYEFSDYIAEGLMKCVIDNALVLADDLHSYQARANIMLASSLSHNGLTGLGKDNKMPIHQLEHELSALKPNISHGEGLAILIPSWMKVCKELDKEKFIKFSENVMGICDDINDDLKIDKAINKLESLFRKFGLSSSLKTFNIQEEDLITMANSLTQNKTRVFQSYIPLDYDLAMKIYQKSMEE